jgi:hypothetical protein
MDPVPMALVLDLLNRDPRPNAGNPKSEAAQAPAELRHPEKQKRPENPILRKPDWIRVKAPGSPKWAETQKIVKAEKLVTVCEEAGCPNIGECWEKKHATFMIMGDTCTRACAFCNVKTGVPQALDPLEPAKVAQAVAKLGLEHVVITSVDRDDLGWRRRAFRPGHPRHPQGFARHHHRDPDARLPAQARRARGRRRGQARRLQPQSRDRAGQVSDGAPRRALFPLAAAAAAGQGARPDDLHQVRHHGRPRRGAERGPAADGRSALGRGRLHHHRPVSRSPRASIIR